MNIAVLDADAVLAAVTPAAAIEQVRAALVHHHAGDWVMPPKVYLQADAADGDFRAMPARGDGLALLKWITSFPGNPGRGLPTVMGVVCVSDANTGVPLMLLDAATVTVLRSWLAERGGLPADPLFITRRGTPLSRDALERRIAKYTATAATTCPSLLEKKVSPHTLRHSAAMRLLSAGIDTSVIALWMGHENTATTQVYIHADLALKERAIARTAPRNTAPGRYQPSDDMLAFLDGL